MTPLILTHGRMSNCRCTQFGYWTASWFKLKPTPSLVANQGLYSQVRMEISWQCLESPPRIETFKMIRWGIYVTQPTRNEDWNQHQVISTYTLSFHQKFPLFYHGFPHRSMMIYGSMGLNKLSCYRRIHRCLASSWLDPCRAS